MKRKTIYLTFFLIIAFLFACTEETNLCRFGKCEKVRRYGLLNEESKRENVVYRIDKSEVIISAILFETVVVPVIYAGFYLYEPVRFKTIKKSKKSKPNQATKSKKRKKEIIIFKGRNFKNKGRREKKDL